MHCAIKMYGECPFQGLSCFSVPIGHPAYITNPCPYFTLALKMEAIVSSEMLITTYKTTQHHNTDHNPASL
jgi:hypothetical protein